MRHVVTILVLIGGFVAVSTVEASAVVCARGVYRAGCVSPGAAVVRRGAIGYRGATVVRRGAVGYRGPTVVRRGAAVRR
jgi:hypothetical protein